ncbi:MAG: helix-turn-helix domain-containing protein [Alphaproteobacteria bacterium]|nr:helix-turn-helix domain-containing protein [Alphaproteobacteria bacterium]
MWTSVMVVRNESDARRARELVARLGEARSAKDVAQLRAQSLLLEAYEKQKWPARAVSVPDIIRYAMEQHGLSPADMAPILGTRSRVTEVLKGQRRLTVEMIRRLHDRLGLPADLLIEAEPVAA